MILVRGETFDNGAMVGLDFSAGKGRGLSASILLSNYREDQRIDRYSRQLVINANRPPLPQLDASNDLHEDGLVFAEFFAFRDDAENVEEILMIETGHHPNDFGRLRDAQSPNQHRSERQLGTHQH